MRLSVALALLGAAALAAAILLSLRGAPASISVTGTEVVVRTSDPSVVHLEYGLTRAYGLFTGAVGPARVHRFELADLAPGKTYDVRAGSATAIVHSPPSSGHATLAVAGDHFTLDGRPWIPLISWSACANEYPAEAAVGIDAFMSSCGDSPQQQASAAARVDGVVIPAVDQAVPALPTTVATYVADEPDLHAIPPAQIAQDAQAHPDVQGLPLFETLSAQLGNGAAYAQVSSSIGVDVYPIMNTGDHSRIGEVASVQRSLEQLAGGKPTYQWIEAIGGASPQEIEAEVWMALCNGARGIGYWTYGKTPFAIDAPTGDALRALNATLDTFAPAIDASPAQLTVSDPTVNAFATQRDGALYVFAVNTSPSSAVTETFSLAGLGGRPVGVYDTSRTLSSSGDRFADLLPPLAWRVYLIAP